MQWKYARAIVYKCKHGVRSGGRLPFFAMLAHLGTRRDA